jgi:uncharacterized protein (DUF4415 family)
MVTKAQETAQANMVSELKNLQHEFYQDWMAGSLPAIWNDIPLMHPHKPDKVKVTLTLDDDMVKWFRKLGRGYQARINSILRVYWQALLSGQIKAHWDAEAVVLRENSLLESLLAQKIEDIQNREVLEGDDEELAKLEQELTESLLTVKDYHDKNSASG